ncbi:MAG: hypothetical protein MET45_07340 [Nostoc sp. LLA-1]|nr:hypothetical protein [Cyanocohniella sp. LLY]
MYSTCELSLYIAVIVLIQNPKYSPLFVNQSKGIYEFDRSNNSHSAKYLRLFVITQSALCYFV